MNMRGNVIRFCWDVIKGRNRDVCGIIHEYKHYISCIDIAGMKFTRETFSQDLRNVCDVLFSIRSSRAPYIIAVLAFGLELDKHYSSHHTAWYRTELLIYSLTDIFVDIGFDPDVISGRYHHHHCTLL